MNRVVLTGNLTKPPESRTTRSGVPNCTFTLAVNRRVRSEGKQQADYIPIVTWRHTAEACAQYLSKGKKVAVVGEIQTRSYEAKDGTKRYVTEVVADEVEFLSPKSEGREAEAPLPEMDWFAEIEDTDDLPF